jgi:hypothetical protein
MPYGSSNSENSCEEITEVIKQFAKDAHISAGILVVENIDRLIDLNSGQDILANHLYHMLNVVDI